MTKELFKEKCYSIADITKSLEHFYTREDILTKVTQTIKDYGDNIVTEKELKNQKLEMQAARDVLYVLGDIEGAFTCNLFSNLLSKVMNFKKD